jgi:hypothetical protein
LLQGNGSGPGVGFSDRKDVRILCRLIVETGRQSLTSEACEANLYTFGVDDNDSTMPES